MIFIKFIILILFKIIVNGQLIFGTILGHASIIFLELFNEH
jgi:hypothetical protein